VELDDVTLEDVDDWNLLKPYWQLFRLEDVEKVEWTIILGLGTFVLVQVFKRLWLGTLAIPIVELPKHLVSIVGRLGSGGQSEVVEHIAVPHHLKV
jgi:hypothetical protein